MKKRINIIYVLSQGRSGSTVLDLILGSYKNNISLGELHNLYWDIKENNICSCGNKILNCAFWSKYLNEKEIIKKISIYREKSGSGKRYRKTKLNKIYKTKYDNLDISGYTYASKNYELLEKIIDREKYTDEICFIDSSKDPYRLYDLLHSGLFNIKIIYLKKNPFAWIFSIHKNNKNISILKIIRSIIDYKIDHFIFETILRRIDENLYLKINYNIIQNSEHFEALIENFLNINNKKEKNEHHIVSGNKIKYSYKEFKPDHSYKNSFINKYRYMINLFIKNV